MFWWKACPFLVKGQSKGFRKCCLCLPGLDWYQVIFNVPSFRWGDAIAPFWCISQHLLLAPYITWHYPWDQLLVQHLARVQRSRLTGMVWNEVAWSRIRRKAQIFFATSLLPSISSCPAVPWCSTSSISAMMWIRMISMPTLLSNYLTWIVKVTTLHLGRIFCSPLCVCHPLESPHP